jgi:AraC-like DNA-binding protein
MADLRSADHGRVSFRTSDLDMAHHYVAEAFSDHSLDARDHKSLQFELNVVPSPRLVIGRLGFGAGVRIDGPPIEFAYHFNIPEQGVSTVAQGGRKRTFRAGEAGVMFTPHEPVTIQWSDDCWQHHVQLPKAHLEQHAAKVVGHPIERSLEFDLTFDLDGDAGRSLRSTTRFLYAELTSPGGLAGMPAACYELESALMTQLLMTVPHQYSASMQTQRTRVRRSKIDDAIEYVDRHVDAYLTAPDLAAAVGVSQRCLQAGFQDRLGISPTGYIRSVRLDRAHLELTAGAGTVTRVAAHWGFFHPGRFAQLYRERFGAHPSAVAAGHRPLS